VNNIYKNSAAMLALLAITACGGRAANPVMSQQFGDQKKGCPALITEMTGIQHEISRLMPNTDKTGKNVALGVAGAFLLVPWFFMDMGHAEQEEVNAYRNRYNHLASIAADKKCDIDTTAIPELPKEEEQPVKRNFKSKK
jgi:hypothetical protein